MPEATLRNLIEEWLNNRWGLRVEPGTHITGSCECGSRARYAMIFSDGVVLANASCDCKDCQRSEIMAGNPQFFDLLQKSLESRVAHKSTLVSDHLRSGDDIQHAVDHFKDNRPIHLEGKFENQQIDLKDVKIIAHNVKLTGCEFNNINQTIEVTGDNNVITGCCFYMGEKSPYWSGSTFSII